MEAIQFRDGWIMLTNFCTTDAILSGVYETVRHNYALDLHSDSSGK